MCTIFGVCFVLRNKIDVPQRKNSKNGRSKYGDNNFYENQSKSSIAATAAALLTNNTTYYNKL